MKLQTKYKKQLKKYQLQRAELEQTIVQLFTLKEKEITESEFEKLFRLFTHTEHLNKSMLKKSVYKDCIYFEVKDIDENIVASRIYNTDGTLRFAIDNVEIYKIKANEGKLFYRGMAIGIKTIEESVKWGIINDKGEFLFEPCYEYLNYGLQSGKKDYFTAGNKYLKEGIIDCNNKTLLPFVYSDIKMYNDIGFSCYILGLKHKKKYLYHYFKEEILLIGMFDEFTESVYGSFIAVQNGKYGWYNNGMMPVVNCEYKSIKVFRDKDYIYNGILYAILTNKENKMGIYHYKKEWFFACVNDKIFLKETEDYVILTKGQKNYIYHFILKMQLELPKGINYKNIKHYNSKNIWVFTAQNTITKMWAVYDDGFNQLTGFHFIHSPEFIIKSNKVIVYISEFLNDKADTNKISQIEFGIKKFFGLFGKEMSKFQAEFLESIDRTSVQIEPKNILYSLVNVAGSSYYDAAKIADKIQKGDKLIMRNEKHNSFDKYAIELYYLDKDIEYKLGYIPKEINQNIRATVSEGTILNLIVYFVYTENNYTEIVFDIVRENKKKEKPNKGY